MMKYPAFLDAKSEEVGCIFEEACFRGDAKVVKLLLKHENSKYIVTCKDGERKTGFIRACEMGREEVVSLLLKHQDCEEMFPIRDGQNMTGFMAACRWGKHSVVKLLLEHPYYKKLQKEYIDHIEDSNVVKNEVQLGFELAKTHGFGSRF